MDWRARDKVNFSGGGGQTIGALLGHGVQLAPASGDGLQQSIAEERERRPGLVGVLRCGRPAVALEVAEKLSEILRERIATRAATLVAIVCNALPQMILHNAESIARPGQ